MTTNTAGDVAKAFGYLTVAEVRGLKKLVKMLPLNPVAVNLGAGSGTSGLAILETREDITLYTVDIRADSPLGSLKSELNAIESSGIEYKDRYTQILGDSAEIGRNWEGENVDMVFVDADHSEAGVRADVEAWLPRIAPMGILAFDDYGEKRKGAHQWIGVTTIVDKLVRPHFTEILHINSLIAFEIV
jgi:predicted O-methyltransferase YrrM